MENFVTSKQTIKELIKSVPEQITKLYIAENAHGNDIKEIVSLAHQKKVSFLTVPKEKLLSIYNQGFSGILAIVSRIRYFDIEEFLENNSDKSSMTVLILDEILDPQNFGAILRTSAGFEVDGVIIQQWNQVQVTQTVMEVSRGAAGIVPIIRVKNVYNAVKRFKKEGFWIYGTNPQLPNFSSEKTVKENISFLSQNKLGIILGNEHKGIRKNIVQECDDFITIKHSENIQSLNVSVVCGIVLYERYKYKQKIQTDNI